MKKLSQLNNKQKILFGACAVAVIAIAVILITILTKPKNFVIDGIIEAGGEESSQVEGLFLKKDTKYFIDMDKLDRCISADVIRVPGGYAIRTTKTQVTIFEDENRYRMNQSDVTDDNSYSMPIVIGTNVFGDADTIFKGFKYDTSYSESLNGKLVRLVLTKQPDSDPYETITAVKDSEPASYQRPKQIEEGAIDYGEETGNGQLKTVPKPEEETYPADVQAVIDNRPTEDNLATKSFVPRDPQPKNDFSDEELDAKWEQEKGALVNIFSQGIPNTGNVAYEVRGDSMLAFNPMNGGIYVDTISITRSGNENHFIVAEFCSDWSDLIVNTDNEGTRAYYAGIPETYRKTIVSLLGENEGTKLFDFIKPHADIMANGGYVSRHDESGEIVSVWTDEPVGDGIMANELDFSEWQNRISDSGVRYSVSRVGEGFKITLYKR